MRIRYYFFHSERRPVPLHAEQVTCPSGNTLVTFRPRHCGQGRYVNQFQTIDGSTNNRKPISCPMPLICSWDSGCSQSTRPCNTRSTTRRSSASLQQPSTMQPTSAADRSCGPQSDLATAAALSSIHRSLRPSAQFQMRPPKGSRLSSHHW